MAKNWIRCAKSGQHGIEEGWTDIPQKRADGKWFISHVCPSCRCLWMQMIPDGVISELAGPDGGVIVGGKG